MTKPSQKKVTFDRSESRLYSATYVLLRTRPRDVFLTDIADGTGIPLGWLKAFSQGRMSDPSVVRVEKLYNWLSDEPLEIPYEL